MAKTTLRLVVALAALAVTSGAYAQNRACPSKDKRVPNGTVECRGDFYWVCDNGEWVKREGARCNQPKT